jgi:predicted phage replisome organizer
MSGSGRFYWLKLQDNFFESAEIKVVLSQENGPAYVCFWLRLLLLALKQEDPGRLRFKDAIPYDEKLLSTVLDTNIDFVRSALKLFGALGMIEKVHDGTILIESVTSMVGSECSSADRVRRFRERQKGQALLVTLHSNTEIEKDIESEKEPPPAASRPGGSDSSPDFDLFWAAYPRKKERKRAWKSWGARLKAGAQPADMIAAARNYAGECERKGRVTEYIKHPSTFLGPSEPWTDYLEGAEPEQGCQIIRVCAHCGARNEHTGVDCWTCGKPLNREALSA